MVAVVNTVNDNDEVISNANDPNDESSEFISEHSQVIENDEGKIISITTTDIDNDEELQKGIAILSRAISMTDDDTLQIQAIKEESERIREAVEKAIENEIIKRDEADMNREISPLKKAEDAYCLDTSDMTFNEVVSKILDMIEKER